MTVGRLRPSSNLEDEADGSPRLSGLALSALSEFLMKDGRSQNPTVLLSEDGKLLVDEEEANPFPENWGLSQFWYTKETASTVAAEVVEVAAGGRIACLACPTLFCQLRTEFPEAQVHLFEFDCRFEALGNFSLYDYRKPLAVAEDLHGQFAVVVADPPYLNENCLGKCAQTVDFLAAPACTRYLLTGAVMRGPAFSIMGLRPATFRPRHSNKLSNEYLLYTSSPPSGRLQGWDPELGPEAIA